jgi:hypothetical protein
MQHRIKCDQVLISKIVVVIYLMVTTGIRIKMPKEKHDKQSTYKRNIEVCSCNYCYSGKVIIITQACSLLV